MTERDFAALGEFAIPFTYAVSKLRKAKNANEGVTLDPAEVGAVVDALRMLSNQVAGEDA